MAACPAGSVDARQAYSRTLARHEDPFDIPRIRRALDRLGLALIRFELPNMKCRADYDAAHPDDKLRRDFDGWMRRELGRPTTFAGMYDFWCRKALA